MRHDNLRPNQPGAPLARRHRLVALLAALSGIATVAGGIAFEAVAQDRPFWDQGDPYGDPRRQAPPARGSSQRDDAYRPPQDMTGAPGGFGQQAGPDGRPYDPQRSYGGATGPGGYPSAPGPSAPGYDPRYDQPRSPAQNGPGYGDSTTAGQRQADPWRGGGAPPRPGNDVYRPTDGGAGYGGNQPIYRPPPGQQSDAGGFGQPYAAPPGGDGPGYGQGYGQGNPDGRAANDDGRRYDDGRSSGSYSQNEVVDAGHRFFGSVSQGLANAVEQLFKSQGRPNGYILGEDAGGAFVAGLRYGEGTLYTKDVGRHRVYWQGPSLGYDFGGEGSKTMVLVYNMRDPADIYARFGGVQGAAYLVGGVSVQFQAHEDVTLAVIRSGVGLRLGANVGYLKYTRSPTWNPF